MNAERLMCTGAATGAKRWAAAPGARARHFVVKRRYLHRNRNNTKRSGTRQGRGGEEGEIEEAEEGEPDEEGE